MKILGIDTSGLVAAVAVVQDGVTVAEYNVNYRKTHSQTLLPMLEEIRRMIGLELDSLDAIAVAAGPGSFTGLRIGSATAKGLGLALGKPLVEVPTLEGLAFNLYGVDRLVCPVMDARRNQVYTGIYEFLEKEHEFVLHTVEAQCAVDISALTDQLNLLGRAVILLGDGVPVFRDRLLEELRVPWHLAPASDNRQRASSIAALGEIYFAQGRYVTAADHSPVYLRLSQAEREALERV